ncbi:HprK-related kinase B [Tropicimonas sediminicola]|uniref:HprK-related kinase B n=1 Tax=Tropicimonas sediminicola TaxID=1031541 RepID=A0A239LCK7_9RHOB|nr:HprK-related kinase B [Tropicimonas sediminicola]SNT28030.1 HprK-related kinase B [Tropicimonas sediminicola]
MSLRTTQDVLDRLDTAPIKGAEPIFLQVGPLRARLDCVDPLRTELHAYFEDALAGPGLVDTVIEVLDGQSLDPQPDWIDWAREPGKTGRKDAIFDLRDGRLVHKVRTGVTFLQSADRAIAFGPCAAHPNQVINFVNTQFLNACQRQGWEICHAAALTDGNRTLAIAGLSGGGKSTTVLRLMDLDGVAYVSNDRLLVRAGTPPDALGIPKLPRINPGTILHNSRLAPMLDADRRADLAAMAPEDLWKLEDKHDLSISRVYGEGRVQFEAALTHFWVLNWSRDGTTPTEVRPVRLAERPDLLSAIMKSPGPFYQKPNGAFLTDSEHPEPAGYLAALEGVEVFEVTGRIDFEAVFDAGRALFGG